MIFGIDRVAIVYSLKKYAVCNIHLALVLQSIATIDQLAASRMYCSVVRNCSDKIQTV